MRLVITAVYVIVSQLQSAFLDCFAWFDTQWLTCLHVSHTPSGLQVSLNCNCKAVAFATCNIKGGQIPVQGGGDP